MTRISLTEEEADSLCILAHGGDYSHIQKKYGLKYSQVCHLVESARIKCSGVNDTHAVAVAISMALIRLRPPAMQPAIAAAQQLRLNERDTRILNMIAQGATYAQAARKNGKYAGYPRRLARRIEETTHTSTLHSTIAVLITAGVIDSVFATPSTLTPQEATLLMGVIMGESANKAARRERVKASAIVEQRKVLLIKLGAETWYHATAIAIWQGQLPITVMFYKVAGQLRQLDIPENQRLALQALAYGATPEAAAAVGGYASKAATSTILRSVKQKTNLRLPVYAIFAGLVWSGHIRAE